MCRVSCSLISDLCDALFVCGALSVKTCLFKLYTHPPLTSPHREILQIEHVSANQEETWRDKRVGKSSATDKRRSNYRNQERRYRELDTEGSYFACPDDA